MQPPSYSIFIGIRCSSEPHHILPSEGNETRSITEKEGKIRGNYGQWEMTTFHEALLYFRPVNLKSKLVLSQPIKVVKS